MLHFNAYNCQIFTKFTSQSYEFNCSIFKINQLNFTATISNHFYSIVEVVVSSTFCIKHSLNLIIAPFFKLNHEKCHHSLYYF